MGNTNTDDRDARILKQLILLMDSDKEGEANAAFQKAKTIMAKNNLSWLKFLDMVESSVSADKFQEISDRLTEFKNANDTLATQNVALAKENDRFRAAQKRREVRINFTKAATAALKIPPALVAAFPVVAKIAAYATVAPALFVWGATVGSENFRMNWLGLKPDSYQPPKDKGEFFYGKGGAVAGSIFASLAWAASAFVVQIFQPEDFNVDLLPLGPVTTLIAKGYAHHNYDQKAINYALSFGWREDPKQKEMDSRKLIQGSVPFINHSLTRWTIVKDYKEGRIIPDFGSVTMYCREVDHATVYKFPDGGYPDFNKDDKTDTLFKVCVPQSQYKSARDLVP